MTCRLLPVTVQSAFPLGQLVACGAENLQLWLRILVLALSVRSFIETCHLVAACVKSKTNSLINYIMVPLHTRKAVRWLDICPNRGRLSRPSFGLFRSRIITNTPEHKYDCRSVWRHKVLSWNSNSRTGRRYISYCSDAFSKSINQCNIFKRFLHTHARARAHTHILKQCQRLSSRNIKILTSF